MKILIVVCLILWFSPLPDIVALHFIEKKNKAERNKSNE